MDRCSVCGAIVRVGPKVIGVKGTPLCVACAKNRGLYIFRSTPYHPH